MRAHVRRLLVLLGLLLWLGVLSRVQVAADEIRLVSGEVLHGEIVETRTDGTKVVETAKRRRVVKARDVAELISGEPPAVVVRERESALASEDADGRLALSRYAWRHRLDEDAARLRDAALEIAPDHAEARAWAGHVRTSEGWAEGWPAPWGAAGTTGKRWGRVRRDSRVVDRALTWLANHQDEDGRIDADGFANHCPEDDRCGGAGGGHHGERMPCRFDAVATALAVLAWMADGSTTVSGPHADSVARGLAFLEGVLERGDAGFDGIWNVAFAVQAIADACCHVRDPHLRDVLARGVSRLMAQQRQDGGWSYVYSIGDVPTTSMVLVALGLAAQAGMGIERERIERALAFLEARVVRESARSEYHDGAEQKGYTPTTANAAGTLAARACLGVLDDTPDLARRLSAATGKKPRWKLEFKEVKTRDGRTVRAQVGNLYPYAWFAASLALCTGKGSRLSSWQSGLRSALRGGQTTEGHAAGSWDPLGPYSESGGRAYVTGLCALMLLSNLRYPRTR